MFKIRKLIHEDYDYEKLCLELENLSRYEGKYWEYFLLKFKLICFEFHLDDIPFVNNLMKYYLFMLPSFYTIIE